LTDLQKGIHIDTVIVSYTRVFYNILVKYYKNMKKYMKNNKYDDVLYRIMQKDVKSTA